MDSQLTEFCEYVITTLEGIGDSRVDFRGGDNTDSWDSQLPPEIVNIAHASAKALGYKSYYDYRNSPNKPEGEH